MDERVYDPAFAVKPKSCPEGCIEYVRINRYIEACPVCKTGRMSREWIKDMKAIASKRGAHG